ncbi:hypothetical protein C7T94_08595 [Pedobacter yulinensis]|uniref:Tryptophan-rich sensory protein n=1 Tax=Pedobacter yulinensis TaxID=2126353 RepID=A0A2T3HJT5_9SPHI|nr:tryptophan-rich sensory protein [Pedobacter yulinensis]PST82704.1 hypothetical protein C7T94_08595 [Pedobacter yulinensis]
MKKVLAIGNTAALIITIAINYLSNTGLLNGNTMGSVSARYDNYFTPAGYAFSIWGLIYLSLAGFIVFNWTSKTDPDRAVVSRIGWWFVISCAANSMWIFAWLYDYTALSVLIMIILFISLFKIVRNAGIGNAAEPFRRRLLVHWPFSIYFGWISVAMIANIAAYLTKEGWDGWGIPAATWAIVMVCVAGLVNILVVRTRRLLAYGLVGIWAVIAIAVANAGRSEARQVVYACYGTALIIAIFVVLTALKGGQLERRQGS